MGDGAAADSDVNGEGRAGHTDLPYEWVLRAASHVLGWLGHRVVGCDRGRCVSQRQALTYERRPCERERGRRRLVVAAAAGMAIVNMLIVWGLVARVREYYPENHWGIDIRLLWGWCGAVAGVCGVLWWFGRECRWWIAGALLSAALLAGVVWFLDHYNLLVEYELWLRRGLGRQAG